MLLADALRLGRELLDEHRHRAPDDLEGWQIGFDNARRRLGCCHYRQKMITLSRHYVALNSDARVRNTLLHEIAHAIAVGLGERGHGRIWQRLALAIGCDAKRCVSGADDDLVAPPRRYTGTCPSGHVSTRSTLPRRGAISCGRCSRRFDPRFLITWRETSREEIRAVYARAAEKFSTPKPTENNEGETMQKKSTKKSAAAKSPAKRAVKSDAPRVCAKRGCKVTEAETLKRNKNYSFRRGLCIDHYRETLRAERAADA